MEDPQLNHRTSYGDHTPEPDGQISAIDLPAKPKPKPVLKPIAHVGVRAPKILTFPNGAVWIPNGRTDNPPPTMSPEKWEGLSRQARRSFAARAMNLR